MHKNKTVEKVNENYIIYCQQKLLLKLSNYFLNKLKTSSRLEGLIINFD